jgi:hypothetical protein
MVVITLSSGMIGRLQPGRSWPDRARDTSVVALSRPRAMVRYRVYWVSLGLPGRPLFVELLETGNDHPEQLDDDAGRDVRHDAQREDGNLEQRAATEQVNELVQAACGLTVLQALLDILVVHTWRGNESTQAEDGDDCQREQQLASQIRRAKGPAKCAKQASSWWCGYKCVMGI